jgi:5-methylcytosine-specific restriction endonuclease McrA
MSPIVRQCLCGVIIPANQRRCAECELKRKAHRAELARLRAPATRIRNSSAWQKLREATVAAAGGRCQRCGATSEPVDVHHIQPILARPDLALDPANLQVLCRGCHRRSEAERQQR